MTFMSVSSRSVLLLPRRRHGTICSRFQFLSCSSSSNLHFHAYNFNPTPSPHIKLQQSLVETYESNTHFTHSTLSPYTQLHQLLDEKSKFGFDNLDDALLLFRKMTEMRPLPLDIHFNQLLNALVKMEHYITAVSLFFNMCSLRIPVNEVTFSIAINCCCHSDRVDYAFSLLAGIFKRGFIPSVVNYTTLLSGLLSQHKSAEAELLFTNLIKFKEVQPNVVTFNTVINVLCKTHHTNMALWLFDFMEKCNCKPNTVTYSFVIDSLCKRALVNDALNLHSEMIEKGILPDVFTYNAIIQVLCNLNRWEEVKLLIKQMIDDMNIYPTARTFNIMVDASLKSGKMDDAKELIEMMNERGQYPNIETYNALLQAYCSHGQLDGALGLLNTIASKKIVPSTYTYNILLNAYCKNMNIDKAMDLYRNMACEGLRPTVATHYILLHGLCQVGKSMEALTFFYKILDQGHKTNIAMYRTLLDGLCKNRYIDNALSFFHEMKCNGLFPRSNTYNIIIRGCLRNKQYNKACKLVDEMFDCGFLADSVTTSLLECICLSQERDPTLRAMYRKCLSFEKVSSCTTK
ncbi:uncharacterized protein LOC141675045 isoform X2 [Apium graveolens]|uniref:uncharacterized protein LOC141675045 isoform X2 n=1 Tax=Apium graveolens TaxID=4045 RepID=UPI003D7AE575